MVAYYCPFEIGQKVIIDGDESIVAFVLCVRFHACNYDVLCGWMHNGHTSEDTIDGFRLSPAEVAE